QVVARDCESRQRGFKSGVLRHCIPILRAQVVHDWNTFVPQRSREISASNAGGSASWRAMNADDRRRAGDGGEAAASIGGLSIMPHLNPFASALALSVSAASLGLLGCSADGGGGPSTDQTQTPGYVGGPGAGNVPAGVGNAPPVGAGNMPPVGAGNFPPVGAG